jgi:hypothetical protein
MAEIPELYDHRYMAACKAANATMALADAVLEFIAAWDSSFPKHREAIRRQIWDAKQLAIQSLEEASRG